jgi:hypothetical protein
VSESEPADPRLYHNRFPGEEYLGVSGWRLIQRDARWKVCHGSLQRTARGLYLFVVLPRSDSPILLVHKAKQSTLRGRPVGHLDLAHGGPILFGGQIAFGSSYNARGLLRWWDDRTGHYHDASSPMDPRNVPLLPQSRFRRQGAPP